MSTFRQLALRVIAESGLEKEPQDDILSPEYVFLWLKARYQTIIDSMPFGAVTQAPPLSGVNLRARSGGTVTVTNGSVTVTGVGTDFQLTDVPTPPEPQKVFRTLTQPSWHYIVAVNVGTQTLTLDSAYVGPTEETPVYGILTPYYKVPLVRWITSIIRDGYGELEELHITKLNELDPFRSLLPGPPTMYSKRLIDPTTGQRYVELYPAPLEVHRFTVYGYSNFEEPLITNSPHREIDDECFVSGAMATAYQYRAQLAATRGSNEQAVVFMRLSDQKRKEFETFVKQISNRDEHDVEMPRVRVRITHPQHLLSPIRDNILDAYSEAWNRP